MNKVVIKILQGSAVTQTVLGGLATCIYPPTANFPQCTCAKNYEIWLRVDNVIAMKTVCSFFGPPCSVRRQSIVAVAYIHEVNRMMRCRDMAI